VTISEARSAVPAASAVEMPAAGSGERGIRRATTAAVVGVAGIAAVVSYRHMAAVALAHGEDRLNAAVIPLSVDGLIAAASLRILASSRVGRHPPALPYLLLCLGSAASLAANVIHAEPTLIARLVSSWPSLALIGSYEMLMSLLRDFGESRPVGTDRGTCREGDQAADGGSAATGSEPATPSDATAPGVRETGLPGRVLTLPRTAEPTRRPGTKRARLRALLAELAADDPRSAPALARDLAPRVELHEGTARRYIAEIRRAATAA
jgi:Protein of unknown function (DUF2637)